MNTKWIKVVLAFAVLTAGASVHAQLHVDNTAISAAIAQVQAEGAQVEAETARVRAARAQGLSANLGALPSTYADAGKAAPAPSADTNQQILATLIGIDTTLKQLLEFERAKATGLFPSNGKASR
ncbi:hypothetical protein ACV22V_31465 [Burkholderia sp. AW33-5]